MPGPWPSHPLGPVGGTPPHSPVWLRTTGPLAGQVGHSPDGQSTVCSQQHRERKPALRVRRGAALTHRSERHSAAPPTTHSPGIPGRGEEGGQVSTGCSQLPGCRLPGRLTALGPPSALAGSDKHLAQLSARGSLLRATLPSLIEHRGLLPGPSSGQTAQGHSQPHHTRPQG